MKFTGHRAIVTTSCLPVRWSSEPSSPSFDRIPKGRPYKVARWGGGEGLVEVGVGWLFFSCFFALCLFSIVFYHAIIPYKTIGENKNTHVYTCNIHGSCGDYDNMIGCLCLETKVLWMPCFFPKRHRNNTNHPDWTKKTAQRLPQNQVSWWYNDLRLTYKHQDKTIKQSPTWKWSAKLRKASPILKTIMFLSLLP